MSIFNVKVQLLGRDGNAFAILGNCQRAARENGISKEEIAEFLVEAQSGDYNHLLQTCMKYFEVE